MVGAVIVEVLDRRERVVQRVRLDAFPATIGRGYANQLVLDDRYVCPAHLRIAADDTGALVVEDLDSVNGLYRLAPVERVCRVPIAPGLRLRAGHTVLRFRSPDEAVAPALVDRTGAGATARLLRPPVAMAACLFALSLAGLHAYASSYEPTALADTLRTAVFMGIFVLVWSTAWALVSRIVVQEWRLLAHVATACLFGVGALAFGLAGEYYAFVFSATTSTEVIDAVGTALLLAGVLNAHLALFSPMAPGHRRTAAVLAAVAVVGLFEGLGRLDRDQFTNRVDFASSLKPVPARWLPSEPVDRFLSDLDRLRAEVDAMAAEQ